MSKRIVSSSLTLGLLALLVTARPLHAGGDWNDKAVGWKSYEDGLAAAKKEKKPICLIFFTDWCPHCANYSKVFHDPKVVETSAKFVMIRLDNDFEDEIRKKYAPDGDYVPRTFFLSPDGRLDPDIHAPREKYRYFYSENDASAVLAGMDAALKKFK